MESLQKNLFVEDGSVTFAILDGAAIPELRDKLFEFQPEHACLYPGELEPDMEEVAPYLVRLDPDSETTRWLLARGWGKNWGIFARSSAEFRDIEDHFYALLTVHDDMGSPVELRYYDPRVLRRLLPACDPEELAGVFGPAITLLLEGEDPGKLTLFRIENGALATEERQLK